MQQLEVDTIKEGIKTVINKDPPEEAIRSDTIHYPYEMREEGDDTTLELKIDPFDDFFSVIWYVPLKFAKPNSVIPDDPMPSKGVSHKALAENWEEKSTTEGPSNGKELGNDIANGIFAIQDAILESEYPISVTDESAVLHVQPPDDESGPVCALYMSGHIH